MHSFSTRPPLEFHPVQVDSFIRDKSLPNYITLRAYEVYCHVHSPQPALVDLAGKNCRGGFSVGEIIAFLYAHSFPKNEWEARVQEALVRKTQS